MAQARTRGSSEGRISSSTRIRGRVAGDGDLLVEGSIEGEIALRGALVIAEGASVTSENVEASEVTVAGALEGNVSASGPVRVAAGSRVRGNLRGSTVAIEEGAQFAGRLDCDFDLPKELG